MRFDFDEINDARIEQFEFNFKISQDLSGEFKLLVFYIINGEVIPDSIKIPVDKCLKNKASSFPLLNKKDTCHIYVQII